MEQMEKLLTVLTAYEPNPMWRIEIFAIILLAFIIGIILKDLSK
jgi:hypothetical protein